MKNKAMALMALFCFGFVALWSQNQPTNKQPNSGLWKDLPEIAVPKPENQAVALPEKFRLLELEVESLKGLLERAKTAAAPNRASHGVMLELPFPDGSFQRFQVWSNQVMSPELAAQHPEIHSFAGVGADNPAAKVFFDFNPYGFHAMVLAPGMSPFFVEPVSRLDIGHYLCYEYSASDWENMKTSCSNLAGLDMRYPKLDHQGEMAGDCQRRTYRIALAANVEFTAAFANPPTDPTGSNGVMNTFNSLVTFINGFYSTELAVRLQLVSSVIFTNADSYTNGDEGAMAGENQGIVDGAIGNGSYDVARAYGTLASGGARGVSLEIGNVCNNGSKAHGATVISAPGSLAVGGFATLEMHELGHQFGANHTFNEDNAGSCTGGQLSPGTAFEPGSGSTIMSYGGTCNASDVQGFRSNYFHAISLQEIGNYITAGTGNTCPVTVGLANNAPTVSISGAATYNIPASTPFRLTATGNDSDGDPLTFCWEQMDNQLINHPPASTATEGPVFRSNPPSASPTRYFPNLNAILTGASPTWEVLPSVSRTMNFRVSARDNAFGGGCTDEDNMSVNVVGSAGPFVITSTGSDPACLYAEDNTTITWNVANTNAAPINCSAVDIWLSLDGGTTFNILLADNTPNDGSESVLIPVSGVTTQGRIMVIGADNIFLDINNNDIRIDCPVNRTVTDNPAVGVYKVRGTLQTMGPVVVPPGTTTRFYAGERVRMNPGFWAQFGSDFQARIKPCDACVAGKPQDLAVENPNPTVYFYEVPVGERAQSMLGASLKATAYPNPFDQGFTIGVDLPVSGYVEIQLMDMAGRSVQTLYQAGYLESGAYQIPVTTTRLDAGVYHCRIRSSGGQAQFKVVKID